MYVRLLMTFISVLSFFIQPIPNRGSWNAIDTNMIIDEQGNTWMVFGSFGQGIKLIRLTSDLIAIAEPQEWYYISNRQYSGKVKSAGTVEAPFIMKHGEYYYLSVSFEHCCRVLQSNYKVLQGVQKM